MTAILTRWAQRRGAIAQKRGQQADLRRDARVDINVQTGLAQVWARCHARFGNTGSVNEWRGTDAFTLLKHANRWTIVSLVFRADDGAVSP